MREERKKDKGRFAAARPLRFQMLRPSFHLHLRAPGVTGFVGRRESRLPCCPLEADPRTRGTSQVIALDASDERRSMMMMMIMLT